MGETSATFVHKLLTVKRNVAAISRKEIKVAKKCFLIAKSVLWVCSDGCTMVGVENGSSSPGGCWRQLSNLTTSGKKLCQSLVVVAQMPRWPEGEEMGERGQLQCWCPFRP